jgi:GNAT superfamily N-acetyltransferase
MSSFPSYRVTLEPAASDADRQVVFNGLRAFNVGFIGEPNVRPVDVFVRDERSRIVGGLVGEIKWRWLYVAKLWLSEELRGRGLGTRLMAEAERFAWEQDCLGIHLDTFEYQALPFYRKLGYEQFGTLEGFPPGYRQYYLKKTRRGS